MGFDFVNIRTTDGTGPVSVSSGSVTYQALNANIKTCSEPQQAAISARQSGSLIVRNGLIVGVVNLSSSAQSY